MPCSKTFWTLLIYFFLHSSISVIIAMDLYLLILVLASAVAIKLHEFFIYGDRLMRTTRFKTSQPRVAGGWLSLHCIIGKSHIQV
jgi:hypothetical protein